MIRQTLGPGESRITSALPVILSEAKNLGTS